MNSLTKLILRFVMYIAVTVGLVSSETAQWVVNDYDVNVVATMAVTALSVEVGLGVRKFVQFIKNKRAAKTAAQDKAYASFDHG